jgi:hypothetical protein
MRFLALLSGLSKLLKLVMGPKSVEEKNIVFIGTEAIRYLTIGLKNDEQF